MFLCYFIKKWVYELDGEYVKVIDRDIIEGNFLKLKKNVSFYIERIY